jgi:hypothetical protein
VDATCSDLISDIRVNEATAASSRAQAAGASVTGGQSGRTYTIRPYMDWMNAIEDIVKRYSGQAGRTAVVPEDPLQHFQQGAQATPANVVTGATSQAFRSNHTPAFPENLSQLFSQSNPNQQAQVLNRLLASLGAGALPGLPGLSGLSSLLQAGHVTPEQPPMRVGQPAAEKSCSKMVFQSGGLSPRRWQMNTKWALI